MSLKRFDFDNNKEICRTCIIPPYSLTVDKDKVPEINLDKPQENKLFYMEFNIEQD